MLRAALWVLRQRRYAALAALMGLLTFICAGAGTFELHRYHEKKHGNAAIIANAHAPAVPLAAAKVSLTGHGAAPGAVAIRFRTVDVVGRYDVTRQQYVGDQTQGGHEGFWVLTPFDTSGGVLLVVRGFVYDTVDGTRPGSVPVPPSGQVELTGRLQTADITSDDQSQLNDEEIASVNSGEQATRLGTPVYQAYLTLASGQPGTADQPGTAAMHALPGPSLSNPTGGAGEFQLLSYVVQWYVFALLALCAPFLFARSEIREARRRYLGVDPDAGEFDLDGRPAAHPLTGGSGELAVRSAAALAQRSGVTQQQWQQAVRLADRYGRSLGVGSEADVPGGPASAAGAGPRRRRADSGIGWERAAVVTNSALTPHRATDDYHGSYNDYLWRLALADGEMPDVMGPGAQDEPAPPRQVEPGRKDEQGS